MVFTLQLRFWDLSCCFQLPKQKVESFGCVSPFPHIWLYYLQGSWSGPFTETPNPSGFFVAGRSCCTEIILDEAVISTNSQFGRKLTEMEQRETDTFDRFRINDCVQQRKVQLSLVIRRDLWFRHWALLQMLLDYKFHPVQLNQIQKSSQPQEYSLHFCDLLCIKGDGSCVSETYHASDRRRSLFATNACHLPRPRCSRL